MKLQAGHVRPRIIAVALGFLLLAGLAVGLAQQTPFPIPRPTSNPSFGATLSFGMIGFSTGETARLNVVNVVSTPPLAAILQVPCRLELDFYDGQGKILKQKVIENLGLGIADLLDLKRAEVISAAGRTEIAVAVKVESNQSSFCSIAPTIEIFDDVTGRTSVILGNPLLSPASFPLPLASPPED